MQRSIKFNMIFTGCVLLLSLFSFFTISKSKAWFSYNTNVDSGGMQISVEAPPNISASVKSYGVIDINDDNNVFMLEPMVNGARPELYALPTDDPNNILYSKYHKALVLMIEITAPNDDVTIELEMWTENVNPSVAQENHFSNCGPSFFYITFESIFCPNLNFLNSSRTSSNCEPAASTRFPFNFLYPSFQIFAIKTSSVAL